MSPAAYLARIQQELLSSAWNRHVSAKAIKVDYDRCPGHVMVLHPTKGWRKISNRRLGL